MLLGRKSKIDEFKKGIPLLYIESVSYLEDGTPFEYYTVLHRGDRFKLITELTKNRGLNNFMSINSNSTFSGILIKNDLKNMK